MIKPTVKPVSQLPKTRQVSTDTVHSAYSDRKSKQYHASMVDNLNPTKTKPNKLTVTSYPGLAN